jgi:HD-GYP domain-containing protein (c-di-GMP phosphodiesterase class II)
VTPPALRRVSEVNKELWLLLSMFVISGILNFLVTAHHMVLGFYALPTLFAAYYYGRRHAVLTAVASCCLVVLLTHFNSRLLASSRTPLSYEKWFDIAIWGGILVLTAYAMGTLYENQRRHYRELRQTYHGVLAILTQVISNDRYTQNHSYRVSVYATRVAGYMGLGDDEIEDIRAAGLLHDIGKLGVSREILYKAARLTEEEYAEVRRHVQNGVDMLQPLSGSLGRVIPMILAHHDKFDGSGHNGFAKEDIPLGARIITVADVYDAMTSDRPYRKAMSPFEARAAILKGSGSEFDPVVVEAFMQAFQDQELEVPEVLV